MENRAMPGSLSRRELLQAGVVTPLGLCRGRPASRRVGTAALHHLDQHRDHVPRDQAQPRGPDPGRRREGLQGLQLLERRRGRTQGDGAGPEGNRPQVRQPRRHGPGRRNDRVHAARARRTLLLKEFAERVAIAQDFGTPDLISFVGQIQNDVPWDVQRAGIVDGLKRAGDIAAKGGVTITLEPLSVGPNQPRRALDRCVEAFPVDQGSQSSERQDLFRPLPPAADGGKSDRQPARRLGRRN